jgi:hypothetical protein
MRKNFTPNLEISLLSLNVKKNQHFPKFSLIFLSDTHPNASITPWERQLCTIPRHLRDESPDWRSFSAPYFCPR